MEKPPTLCLNMIVKNESKIINRLLESVYKIIDCYCICDTGSSDNTKQLITDFFNSKQIIGKVVETPFIDFQHNRNFALRSALGMSDYILLIDADMKIVLNNFDKNILRKADAWHILQGNNDFFYKNIRIIKNMPQIHYIGVTHEYVNIPNGLITDFINRELFFITDYGDGGCKTNKTTRDIKLLSDDLLKPGNANNIRSIFYLANSYQDIGEYENAIKYYKRRIELGGWLEEIWYSYYRLGICYKNLQQIETAIRYWLEGYEVQPCRLENIYQIVNYYRLNGKNKLALGLLNMIQPILTLYKNGKLDINNYLFFENDIYSYKLDYEYIIIAYYNDIKNIDKYIVNVLNHDCFERDNVLSNMKFYNNILKHTSRIDLSDTIISTVNNKLYTFYSSSASLMQTATGYKCNIRYVNYKLVNNYKNYEYDNFILTINRCICLDNCFNVVSSHLFNDIKHNGEKYGGIEDIRIFQDINTDTVLFIGTGLHKNGNIGIMTGKYDSSSNYLLGTPTITDFNNNTCEKNWVYVNYNNNTCIVYSWNPLRICSIKDNVISVILEKPMPILFKMVRGSSCGFTYKDEIWFVCHLVSYETPRHYYSIIVIFDKNINLLRYTAPFKFSSGCIEYCIGLIVNDNNIIITHSEYDKSTILSVYDKTYIESLLIYK